MGKPLYDDLVKRIKLLEKELSELRSVGDFVKQIPQLSDAFVDEHNKMEDTYRKMFEDAIVGIFQSTPDGRYHTMNPTFARMYGYESPTEMMASITNIGKQLYVNAEDHAKIKHILDSDGILIEFESLQNRKDGSPFWISINARMVMKEGEVDYYEGTVIDITRRKEAEEARLIGYNEDITRRVEMEERLRNQLALNMALTGLAGSIISPSFPISDIAIIVLEYAKLLTDSEYGYVSEIDPKTKGNIIHTFSKMMEEGCQVRGEKMPMILSHCSDGTYPGLWGHVLNTREAFYTNEPELHKSSAGTPPGHIALTRFLTAPVIFNNMLVGQIALANASRPYTSADLVTLRRLASLYAMGINRIRSEEKLKMSLDEKEVLIKELHHRVKNNMQVMSSLLALQSRKIDDKKYQSLFQESQNRIHAMALVHERLYHSEEIAKVDFSRYLYELTQHLFYSYNINRDLVTLNLNVWDVYLGIDAAVPCAMIINELVSNSLKHAFPEGRKGVINVSLMKNDEQKHVLAVLDDGIGFPAQFDISKSDSLGMQIIQSLTRQLNGSLAVEGARGTAVTIQF